MCHAYNEDSRLLTEKEVSMRYNIPVGTLQQMRVRGGGPIYIKRGRSVRYRVRDIEEWIHSRRRGSTSDPGGSVTGDLPR
jgi:hypothetical protein